MGKKHALWLFCLITALLSAACSFDYGDAETGESNLPDITMEDMEYVRMRKGAPVARLQAELAERYETRHRMELKNYSFEQYNTTNEETDAVGNGGFASVEMDTSNIHMSQGVEISVDTEDIILGTERLDWDDGKKVLRGGDRDPVNVEQSDGTEFSGIGFAAEVRSRSWTFSSTVEGIYVHEDEEENKPDAKPKENETE